METSELASKALNGGVWSVLGAFATMAVNYFRDKKKDDSDNTLGTLGVINEGSRQLMEALLQSTKMLDQQLRETRAELRATDQKLDACETMHHAAGIEMADMKVKLEKCLIANSILQPVSPKDPN